jgi:hypothetical protein
VLAFARVEVTRPHVYSDARTVTERTFPSESNTPHNKHERTVLCNINSFGVKCGPEAQPIADGVYTRNVMTLWKSGFVG